MKKIAVMSDLEMGGGNLTDDFISDLALSETIDGLKEERGGCELIFNGDTFDTIRMPVLRNGIATHPILLDAESACRKLDLVKKAHGPVFRAIREFCLRKGNSLTFVVGNHDPELIMPEVQKHLVRLLGIPINKVIFAGYCYRKYGIYLEHGHQHDVYFKVETEKAVSRFRQTEIAHTPIFTMAIINHFLPLKKKYPFSDRIKPRPVNCDRGMANQSMIELIKFICGLYTTYWFRYWGHPINSLKRKNEALFDFFNRLATAKGDKTRVWRLDDVIRRMRNNLENEGLLPKYVVFGHTHNLNSEEIGGVNFVQSGFWRDEYRLDEITGEVFPKPKGYLEFTIDGQEVVNMSLRSLTLKRSKFRYTDLKGNETDFIHKAAEEEGYRLLTTDY